MSTSLTRHRDCISAGVQFTGMHVDAPQSHAEAEKAWVASVSASLSPFSEPYVTQSIKTVAAYVSPVGDDRNDGTSWASAKKTIKAAIALSALATDPDHDVRLQVRVAEGSYFLSDTECKYLLDNSSVELMGGYSDVDGSMSKFTGGTVFHGGRLERQLWVSNVKLEGTELNNARVAYSILDGCILSASYCYIEHCIIKRLIGESANVSSCFLGSVVNEGFAAIGNDNRALDCILARCSGDLEGCVVAEASGTLKGCTVGTCTGSSYLESCVVDTVEGNHCTAVNCSIGVLRARKQLSQDFYANYAQLNVTDSWLRKKFWSEMSNGIRLFNCNVSQMDGVVSGSLLVNTTIGSMTIPEFDSRKASREYAQDMMVGVTAVRSVINFPSTDLTGLDDVMDALQECVPVVNSVFFSCVLNGSYCVLKPRQTDESDMEAPGAPFSDNWWLGVRDTTVNVYEDALDLVVMGFNETLSDIESIGYDPLIAPGSFNKDGYAIKTDSILKYSGAELVGGIERYGGDNGDQTLIDHNFYLKGIRLLALSFGEKTASAGYGSL